MFYLIVFIGMRTRAQKPLKKENQRKLAVAGAFKTKAKQFMNLKKSTKINNRTNSKATEKALNNKKVATLTAASFEILPPRNSAVVAAAAIAMGNRRNIFKTPVSEKTPTLTVTSSPVNVGGRKKREAGLNAAAKVNLHFEAKQNANSAVDEAGSASDGGIDKPPTVKPLAKQPERQEIDTKKSKSKRQQPAEKQISKTPKSHMTKCAPDSEVATKRQKKKMLLARRLARELGPACDSFGPSIKRRGKRMASLNASCIITLSYENSNLNGQNALSSSAVASSASLLKVNCDNTDTNAKTMPIKMTSPSHANTQKEKVIKKKAIGKQSCETIDKIPTTKAKVESTCSSTATSTNLSPLKTKKKVSVLKPSSKRPKLVLKNIGAAVLPAMSKKKTSCPSKSLNSGLPHSTGNALLAQQTHSTKILPRSSSDGAQSAMTTSSSQPLSLASALLRVSAQSVPSGALPFGPYATAWPATNIAFENNVQQVIRVTPRHSAADVKVRPSSLSSTSLQAQDIKNIQCHIAPPITYPYSVNLQRQPHQLTLRHNTVAATTTHYQLAPPGSPFPFSAYSAGSAAYPSSGTIPSSNTLTEYYQPAGPTLHLQPFWSTSAPGGPPTCIWQPTVCVASHTSVPSSLPCTIQSDSAVSSTSLAQSLALHSSNSPSLSKLRRRMLSLSKSDSATADSGSTGSNKSGKKRCIVPAPVSHCKVLPSSVAKKSDLAVGLSQPAASALRQAAAPQLTPAGPATAYITLIPALQALSSSSAGSMKPMIQQIPLPLAQGMPCPISAEQASTTASVASVQRTASSAQRRKLPTLAPAPPRTAQHTQSVSLSTTATATQNSLSVTLSSPSSLHRAPQDDFTTSRSPKTKASQKGAHSGLATSKSRKEKSPQLPKEKASPSKGLQSPRSAQAKHQQSPKGRSIHEQGGCGHSSAKKRLSPATNTDGGTLNDTKLVSSSSVVDDWIFEGEPYFNYVFTACQVAPARRLCYPSMRHCRDGQVILVHDNVLVRSAGVGASNDESVPYVAKITGLYADPDSGQKLMSLLWYYRPEQMRSPASSASNSVDSSIAAGGDGGQGAATAAATHVGGLSCNRMPRRLTSADIYASRHRDQQQVATIEDKCHVLTRNQYMRWMAEIRRRELGRPVPVHRLSVPEDEVMLRRSALPGPDVSEDNVFLCRGYYDFILRRVVRNPGLMSPKSTSAVVPVPPPRSLAAVDSSQSLPPFSCFTQLLDKLDLSCLPESINGTSADVNDDERLAVLTDVSHEEADASILDVTNSSAEQRSDTSLGLDGDARLELSVLADSLNVAEVAAVASSPII